MRPRRPSAAMVVAFVALFVALSGAGYAATKISGKSIRKGSIPADRIKRNSLTGRQINESKLRTVPKAAVAAKAADADKLGGEPPSAYVTTSRHRSFSVKLAVGEARELITAGGVGIDAKCDQSAGSDRVRLLGKTTVANSFLNGNDNLPGGAAAANFLQPATLEEDRVLIQNVRPTGATPNVNSNIDQGYVMAPDGTMLSINSEGWALGLNVVGVKCYLAGTVDVITP